jgi:3-deoxy-D-manno-octulosonate 8-phosphate phosphatase (KDO 8-P phosphatase)
MKFNDIKLVISEVDGIVTEGLSGIGEMNITMFKQFYTKDFEAVNKIKEGKLFAFLSSDAAISMSTCKTKNIPFFHAAKSKKEVFNTILRRYSVTADNVLYVASTYSDIECMKMAALSVCPEDSPTEVKNVADLVIPMMGGTGVLCYVYDFLEANRNTECDGICQP